MGHDSSSICITVDCAFAFATVLGGVGNREYTHEVSIDGKVEVVSSVLSSYHG